jgi:hypothetical protein
MDKIRCPNCRGSKKVAKIGGMIGDCNACLGTGSINAEDKPKPIPNEPSENVTSIIEGVAKCIPASDLSRPVGEVVIDDPLIKVDPKRTLYKRKKA